MMFDIKNYPMRYKPLTKENSYAISHVLAAANIDQDKWTPFAIDRIQQMPLLETMGIDLFEKGRKK